MAGPDASNLVEQAHGFTVATGFPDGGKNVLRLAQATLVGKKKESVPAL